MTPEQINVSIAEACGRHVYNPFDHSYPQPVCQCGLPRGLHDEGPDYYHSLDACAEMRKCVPPGRWEEFKRVLRMVTMRDALTGTDLEDRIIGATAPQHCETFCRVMNLWRKG